MQHIYTSQAHVGVRVKPCPALRRPTAITCRVPWASRRNVVVAYSDGHDDVALEGPVRRAFLSIGVSNDDWNRATRIDQAILDYKPDRVYAMIDLLLDTGLTGSDIAQILLAYPQAFTHSVEHHGAPVLAFLREDLGLGPGDVRRLVTRFPAVLGMNVKGQLRPQLAYLASLGVSRESLPQLVLARPLVLGPGIETVTSFLSRCGVPRSQLHRLLASYPLDYRVHLRVSVLGGSSAGGGTGGSSSGGRSSSGGSGL